MYEVKLSGDGLSLDNTFICAVYVKYFSFFGRLWKIYLGWSGPLYTSYKKLPAITKKVWSNIFKTSRPQHIKNILLKHQPSHWKHFAEKKVIIIETYRNHIKRFQFQGWQVFFSSFFLILYLFQASTWICVRTDLSFLSLKFYEAAFKIPLR